MEVRTAALIAGRVLVAAAISIVGPVSTARLPLVDAAIFITGTTGIFAITVV